MTDDTPLGSFEEQVMLAVLHAGDDAYGMNVRRQIETRTDRDVAIGAVYATLDRLEVKRFIFSMRPRVLGGSRRVFRVTATGVRALAATRAMRDELWRGVDLTRLATTGRA